MKTIRKILALVLVAVMCFTITGCLHKKDEIAVTVGDVKFTSAYYMCALMMADGEARNYVMQNLTEEEQETQEYDLYSKKVEDKDYIEWVEARAIEILKEIAAYQLLCKDNKLELDPKSIENVENAAYTAWNGSETSYYAPDYLYYIPNGVAYTTYVEFYKNALVSTFNSLYKERYFNYLYDKDGVNAISDDDVKNTIYENFVIADVLDATYETGATDEQKKELKTKLEAYAKDLQEGKKTFEQVYAEYNKQENHKHEETEDGPKDEHAAIFGTEATKYVFGTQVIDYNTAYYSKINSMKTGEAVVVDNTDGNGLVLFFKQDIKADPYYLENLDVNARHIIADEGFDKIIKDYIAKLKPEVSSYAIGQFDVDEIVYPTEE